MLAEDRRPAHYEVLDQRDSRANTVPHRSTRSVRPRPSADRRLWRPERAFQRIVPALVLMLDHRTRLAGDHPSTFAALAR
jgi:hypothetical protein